MRETDQARWERINAMGWDELIAAVQAKAAQLRAPRREERDDGDEPRRAG